MEMRVATRAYRCEECIEHHGREVRALVRMIPRAVVVDGALVGDEYWCCPLCHRPKFDLKKKPFALKGK